MKSHEYAVKLKEAAEFLLSKDELELDSGPLVSVWFWNKEQFIAVVKALGSGEKEVTERDVAFVPLGTCLRMVAPRNLVCRKVQEEKWECEPLLSQDEMDSIGAEQSEEIPF